ncbi:MAG: phage capsid protein [Corynebacterium nuruki]|nr:phage capsid protein [Corynebacterium nuruki]
MAITLAEAKLNTQEDYDPAVIDEFRKSSALLDAMIFDTAVNPAQGGATMTYGYRRLVTQADAAFRAINSEYADSNVTTARFSVDLAVLGGAFKIDRVLANLGPAASNEVTLQMGQKIKAANTAFADAVINGDTAVDANGFDGLDKALLGSDTEIGADDTVDWSDFDTDTRAEHKALDVIDEFLGNLDGTPTVILGNKATLARVRAAARRAGQYTKDPVEDLVGAGGRPIERESYGGVTFVDPGNKAGTNDPIIPIDAEKGTTSLYAVRIGLDGFHGVTTTTGELVHSWLPDFTTSGAVKRGEVELGPVAVALKATKAAAVLRNIKVR